MILEYPWFASKKGNFPVCKLLIIATTAAVARHATPHHARAANPRGPSSGRLKDLVNLSSLDWRIIPVSALYIYMSYYIYVTIWNVYEKLCNLYVTYI
jgi:hypothetical protein